MKKNNSTNDKNTNGPYARCGLMVRLLYLFVSFTFWILSGLGFFLARRRIVLCYHGIAADQSKHFEDQMMRLRANCTAEAKNKPIVQVTFDDAFGNLLANVLPLLNRLRISAIIFAVPGNFGQSPKWNIASGHPEYNEKTMTAQQIKNIYGNLIKIGSHTQTHPNLSTLSGEEVRWELTESKSNLEQLLGKPVEDLALPHGAYNAEVLHIAQEVGYKRVYTLEPKLVRASQKIGVIGRFSMSPDVWPIEFYLTCAGAYSWLFSFRQFVKWVGL